MTDHQQNAGFHWDGTPRRPRVPRNMRVWSNNASQELRANAQAQCMYCGHPMEYFDRFDGGRIPMVLVPFPSHRILERYRWHINGGVAYRGDGGMDRCRLPHPVVCPMAEHTDEDPDLNDVRRKLALGTRKAINAGTFTPRVQETNEAEVAEQHVQAVQGTQRHVVRHATALWLAPTTVDDLRCTARVTGTSDGRCETAVLTDEPGAGSWQEVEIPTAQGREGQRVLAAGDTMWVWTVHVLDFTGLQRWVQQRCPDHWPLHRAPNAVSAEWVHFNPVSHEQHILHQRPADLVPAQRRSEDPFRLEFGPTRTQCAMPDCRNGTVMKVEEGWLCYSCERKENRRTATHRKWQGGSISPE